MTLVNLPIAYANADIDNMPTEWRKEFNDEVAAGNFLLGGKSLTLVGPGAENAARHWIACLLLGNFKCYRITPFELIRRAEGKAIPGDSDERLSMFLAAECLLIDDFFDPLNAAFTGEQLYLLAWHLRELLRAGVTCLTAVDNAESSTDAIYNDHIWQMVEENFEVIKNGRQTVKKAFKAPRKSTGIK